MTNPIEQMANVSAHLHGEVLPRVFDRVWVMRIKSGTLKGTATSWDGPPSNAYKEFISTEEHEHVLAQIRKRAASVRGDILIMGNSCFDSMAVHEQAQSAIFNIDEIIKMIGEYK